MELEGLQHKCGVIGFVHCRNDAKARAEVPNIIGLGIVGLQHRGQESAGMVVSPGILDNKQSHQKFNVFRSMGHVSSMFTSEILETMQGICGIGHTRYSTHGSSNVFNSQPFVMQSTHGEFSVAHNGELVNAANLRKKLLRQGVGLSSESDSEILTQLLCVSPENDDEDIDWAKRVKYLMSMAKLSYSLIIMHRDRVIAVRDRFGNRPLCLGRVNEFSRTSMILENRTGPVEETNNKTTLGWIVSSESCVFSSIGAVMERQVIPGEIVEVSSEGFRSLGIVPRDENESLSFCIFEYVYFARPDSYFEGQQVYQVRKLCGKQLALEAPADADMVSNVPESATPAAHGYAEALGLPYIEVLTKNRYVGRSFIQPTTHLRKLSVLKKFGVLDSNFEGKRIVLLDDSIVRGNTMAPIVHLLKSRGAKEVHIRVASPPLKHPCYMGINIPTREELIANFRDPEALGKFLGADSLQYLSVEGLHRCVRNGLPEGLESGHCDACLTGNYPVPIDF